MHNAPQPGDGVLRIDRIAGRSTVTRVAARSPLKLLTPRPRASNSEHAVHVVTSSYGGGLVAGDRLTLRVSLGPAATALLTTQASTKVYRRDGLHSPGIARQDLHATLGLGSLLAVLPDPVTPFADAAYEQTQRIDMAADAGLVLLDWLTAGRIEGGGRGGEGGGKGGGERWAFGSYRSHTEVSLGGRCVLADGLWLDPAHGPLTDPHRMGWFNCLATLLVLGEPLREEATRLVEAVDAEPPPRRADLITAVSPHPHGAVLRAAGVSVEAVGLSLRRRLGFLTDRIGFDYYRRTY